MPESNPVRKPTKKQYYESRQEEAPDNEEITGTRQEVISAEGKPSTKGYYGGDTAEAIETSVPNPVTPKAKSKGLGRLKATVDITGLAHQSYRIYPLLTEEQALFVEQQTGVIVKRKEGNISGFLGGGAFGEFYVGERLGTKEDQRFVGIKVITNRLEESAEEASIQQALTQTNNRASHLMPLYEAIAERNAEGDLTRLYYVMPLAALGNAANLRAQLNTLDNAELKRLVSWHIAQGLLLGLWQMHQQHSYHLDVKLANVVIDLKGWVSIIDFGCAVTIVPEVKTLGQALLTTREDPQTGRYIGNGDPNYFAPERPEEAGETFDCIASDLYSAGLALWELWTGERVKDYRKDYPGHAFLDHPQLQNVPANSLGDLVKRLIQPAPAQRWSLLQALNHPIFQAPDLHDQETMQVVLDFLKRFVQQVQLKARDESMEVSLNALAPSSAVSDTTNLVDTTLKRLQDPFAHRPDIQEQLSLYLPLQGSLAREVKDPEKDCFALIDKTTDFLNSDNAVLVLLADGGAGKSLFTQHLATELLQKTNLNSNTKPWLPLYIALGSIQHPENLLQEGLGLSHEDIKNLQTNYRLLLITDGYDEQSHWVNLYVQNQLHRYEMKMIITSRINALPPYYSPYFVPQVPGERLPRGYQEIYVQSFNTKQIDAYIQNYVAHQQARLQVEVKDNRLHKEWLEVSTYQNQVNNTPGLKELLQTPLLCRLSLEALPELAKTQNNNSQSFSKITRAQVYEAFMTRWIEQQRIKHSQPPSLEEVFALGQRTALSLYQSNRAVQVNIGIMQFQFNAEKGHYQQQSHALDWFVQAKVERNCLPLQEVQKGQYKFTHFSMQEFLLARHLYQQLKQAKNLKNLDWNQLVLTTEIKDRPLLYFLGDWANTDASLQEKLFQFIEQTKIDKSQTRSGANAITILNAGGIQLNSKDFRGIAIPQADLSGMVADNTDWSGADLTGINLKGAWLRNSKFIKARLTGVRFYEHPFIKIENNLVENVCYSPDARFIAVASSNNVILYETRTRKVLYTLDVGGQGSTAYCVQFSPDGQRLIAGVGGYQNNNMRVWETSSGKELFILRHDGAVKSVQFSPDGERIVSASEFGPIRVWEVTSRNCLFTFEEHKWDRVNSVHYSLDGKYIVSGNGESYKIENNTIRIWDVATKRCLLTLEGHTKRVTSVQFSSDGRWILSGSDDYTVRMWEVSSGKCLFILEGHTGPVTSVQFSPDGRWILSGSDDYTVRVWEASSGKGLFTLEGHTSHVKSVQFSPDGKWILSGSWDYTVRTWEATAGKVLFPSEGHTNIVESVQFSPDEQRVLSGSYDKTVRVWEATSGKTLSVLKGHTDYVASVQFSPDGKRILSGSHDKTVRVWEATSGQALFTIPGHANRVTTVQFSPNGERILSGSSSSVDKATIYVWEATSGQALFNLTGNNERLMSVQFSPDGKWILSGMEYGVQVWDATSRKNFLNLAGGYWPTFVSSIQFSPDGQRIISGNGDSTIRMWDARNIQAAHQSVGPDDTGVSIERNDKFGKTLFTLKEHGDCVSSAQFSSDGQHIISGSYDRTVRVWDVTSGKCLQIIPLPQAIHSMAYRRVKDQDNLIVSFGTTVAYFKINADFTLSLLWLASSGTQLFLQGVDITEVLGLDETNQALFKQQGAIGEPAIPQSKDQEQKVGAVVIEAPLRELSNSQDNTKELGQPSALPTQDNNTASSVNNNNSPSAFPKAPPAILPPKSLLFTSASTISPIASFQRWAQSMATKGQWHIEREDKTLRVQFDALQKTASPALILTPLREHISQLPADWQQKVAAYQQEGPALIIRCRSEADAKDCEAPLKNMLSTEESKLNEACSIS